MEFTYWGQERENKQKKKNKLSGQSESHTCFG